MKLVRIACLVEGDGEVQAVPVLLRRVVGSIDPLSQPIVARPFRRPSGSIRGAEGLENAITVVRNYTLDTRLTKRARLSRPDLHISVVLAHREFESWFIAAAKSLAGKRSLDSKLLTPDNWEKIRDAKGWLIDHSVGPGRYSPTQDQAALAHWLDLEQAQRSRSFRKLWKEVEVIVRSTDAAP